MKKIPLIVLSSLIASSVIAESTIDIGGAVRLNYAIKDYDEKQKDKLGDFDFELFRLDVNAKSGDWYLDAQYRWYPGFGFDTVHHALVGFNVDASNQVEVGIHQVPFGIEGFASHGFWFSGAFYLGYEDDYDAGIKWKHKGGDYRIDTAFYLSSELSSGQFKRYSFDVASEGSTDSNGNHLKNSNYFGGGDGSAQNEEAGQFNIRFVKDFGSDTSIGASLEYGRIYNNANNEDANHRAIALHATHNMGPWNFQLELIDYAYDDDVNIGTDDGTIAISGFDYASDIAAEGRIATFNVAHKFETNTRLADSVTCYNDFSHIQGTAKGAGDEESIQNALGCMVAKGSIYTYVDVISGKNMYFIGGKGIGVQDRHDWNTRLNINIGWYF